MSNYHLQVIPAPKQGTIILRMSPPPTREEEARIKAQIEGDHPGCRVVIIYAENIDIWAIAKSEEGDEDE